MATDNQWTEEELKATVDAYAEMYLADHEGRRVIKKQIYKDLEKRFDRRD